MAIRFTGDKRGCMRGNPDRPKRGGVATPAAFASASPEKRGHIAVAAKAAPADVQQRHAQRPAFQRR